MRIGELARLAEVSRDTIRFYERHGLIRPSVDPQAPNNYRVYPEDAVLTLEVIRDAQAAGLSISDITLFFGAFMAQDGGGDADVFLEAKIAEVTDKIVASQRFLAMLRDTRQALKQAPQDGLDEVNAQADRSDNATEGNA